MFWVCCRATFPHVVIGICYRPPSADSSFISQFHDAMCAIFTTYPSSPILLFGDFNFPSIDWSDIATTLSRNNLASEFASACLNFGLSQIVSKPTRTTTHSANTLDLILTTHPDNFSDITYLPGFSDHVIIHSTFPCNLLTSKRAKKALTLYNKGDYLSISNELSKFCDRFTSVFHSRTVESNWQLFKSEMLRLIKLHIPTIKVTERANSPWFNNTLKRLNNKKKCLLRSAKALGSSLRSSSAWQKYHAAAKHYNSLSTITKRNFFSITLPSMLHNNPKRFWRTMNPHQESIISLCDDMGSIIPDIEVANVLNMTFSSVFTNESTDNMPDILPYTDAHMSSITFDPPGIVKIIDSLKNSSSTGIDGINAKVLKNTKHHSSIILSKIFQQSLNTGTIPVDWRIGKVIPVFKKGTKSCPKNYRPI